MKKKFNKSTVVLANQRLRFFLMYRQLVLLERTDAGFKLTQKVVLHDDEGALKKALVWLEGDVIRIDESIAAIPSGYLKPYPLSFDNVESSFWNDQVGNQPGIIVGTGDLRNATPEDNVDDALLTLAFPTTKASAIIFEFVDLFRLNLYAKVAPSKKGKK